MFTRSLSTLLVIAFTGVASCAQTAPEYAASEQYSASAGIGSVPQAQAASELAETPLNVIFMIPDGFGPASLTLGRGFKGEPLALDRMISGVSRTAATNSRVTDSAAGATAYSTGHKTYNGAIAVDTAGLPLATILEAAERAGLSTGLIATSRITHATPASYAAHVPRRSMEAQIAQQMLDQGIEVIFGGGRSNFIPRGEGGRRRDGKNLLALADSLGYTVALAMEAYEAISTTPALALLADSHLEFEIDRDPTTQPSLAEMTAKAIDLLSGNEKGFFLMIEGSRIDHAGHANDVAGHVHDILAFDDAVRVALDFAAQDGNTLVISAADHETGGMTLGVRIGEQSYYDWRPDFIAGIQRSYEGLSNYIEANPEADMAKLLREDMNMPDLDDALVQEMDSLFAASNIGAFYNILSTELNERARIGWTTGGHTGLDVNLASFGPGAERFTGSMENAEVGQRVAELLGYDLAALTEEMRSEE
ncbi:MAG: alkaline phosphatase [Bacteroidota bacterium]